jgi:hypothetical protein
MSKTSSLENIIRDPEIQEEVPPLLLEKIHKAFDILRKNVDKWYHSKWFDMNHENTFVINFDDESFQMNVEPSSNLSNDGLSIKRVQHYPYDHSIWKDHTHIQFGLDRFTKQVNDIFDLKRTDDLVPHVQSGVDIATNIMNGWKFSLAENNDDGQPHYRPAVSIMLSSDGICMLFPKVHVLRNLVELYPNESDRSEVRKLADEYILLADTHIFHAVRDNKGKEPAVQAWIRAMKEVGFHVICCFKCLSCSGHEFKCKHK